LVDNKLKYYFINYNVLLSLDSVSCFSSLQMNVVKGVPYTTGR